MKKYRFPSIRLNYKNSSAEERPSTNPRLQQKLGKVELECLLLTYPPLTFHTHNPIPLPTLTSKSDF